MSFGDAVIDDDEDLQYKEKDKNNDTTKIKTPTDINKKHLSKKPHTTNSNATQYKIVTLVQSLVE